MTKKQALGIIIAAVLAGWLFNFLAGGFLMARVSTWPLLNRWKILSPQAPIVINNHDTVRVSDSGDSVAAVNDIKSKLSSVALVNGTSITVVGTAINLTSDGSFVTAAGTFKSKSTGAYYVILNDGSTAKITQQATDSPTSLVFFKAPLNGVPVANLSASQDLSVGDRVLLVEDSLQKFNVRAAETIVGSSQKDVEGQIFLSDAPSRSFGIATTTVMVQGEALVNTNGDIIGMWNGNNVISSDVLRQAMALYFNNPLKIQRPGFGFSYTINTQTDAQLTGQPLGARVLEVDSLSPAHIAGLEAGDVITSFGGQTINESTPLEPALQQYKAGDQISLTVNRKNQTINLSLTAGELK